MTFAFMRSQLFVNIVLRMVKRCLNSKLKQYLYRNPCCALYLYCQHTTRYSLLLLPMNDLYNDISLRIVHITEVILPHFFFAFHQDDTFGVARRNVLLAFWQSMTSTLFGRHRTRGQIIINTIHSSDSGAVFTFIFFCTVKQNFNRGVLLLLFGLPFLCREETVWITIIA